MTKFQFLGLKTNELEMNFDQLNVYLHEALRA